MILKVTTFLKTPFVKGAEPHYQIIINTVVIVPFLQQCGSAPFANGAKVT
jgi:hypothetical protein